MPRTGVFDHPTIRPAHGRGRGDGSTDARMSVRAPASKFNRRSMMWTSRSTRASSPDPGRQASPFTSTPKDRGSRQPRVAATNLPEPRDRDQRPRPGPPAGRYVQHGKVIVIDRGPLNLLTKSETSPAPPKQQNHRNRACSWHETELGALIEAGCARSTAFYVTSGPRRRIPSREKAGNSPMHGRDAGDFRRRDYRVDIGAVLAGHSPPGAQSGRSAAP